MKKLVIAALMVSMPLSMIYCEEEEEKAQTEFSFIRDFMMPVGIPTVSAYYAVRDNIFLNTRSNRDNFFEAVGNVFLAPTRYLFAGKSARIADAECEVKQNFTYKKFHWLKTPLSIVALPFSFVAGSIFKAIGYLSPKARSRHRVINASLHSSKVESNLSTYEAQGLAPFYSEEFADSQNLARPSNILKKHQIEVQALKDVAEILDREGIIYWLDCGTALGAYRYGGFIPWDYDVDIAILMPDHENVKRALMGLDQNKYAIQDWSSYTHPGTFLKLYIKETKTQIDIFHYVVDEKEKAISFYFTYLNSPFPESWKKAELLMMDPLPYGTIFPLKKANFDGMVVWAPNDIATFLKSKYGDNLDPTMIWDEASHKYQKVEDHPYWKDIE